jgi:hypothetical protein
MMEIRPTPRRAFLLRPALCLAIGVALAAPPLEARQRNEGADITGGVSDRDNTRVAGTVFDPEGNPMPNVNIWVVNHDSPANRQRTRTRKTGTYLARNLAPLLEEFNLEGINLRLTFERDGYRSVETTIGVARNALGTVHPILWPEGQEPQTDAIYALLTGQITTPEGKPAKDATLRIGSPEDPELSVEAEVDKNGTYEALLWAAPRVLRLDAAAPGHEASSQEISLTEQARPDLVQVATYDISLGG